MDSIEVPPNSNIKLRFAAALQGDGLDPEVRSICTWLSENSLADATKAGNLAVDPIGTSNSPQANRVESTQPQPELVKVANDAEFQVTTAPADVKGYDVSPVSEFAPSDAKEPMLLEWEPPDDHVSEIQDALTLFERALVAFVYWRLWQLHGPAWLRRGCGSFRKDWAKKQDNATANEPKTLLGYADIGNLKDIIIMSENWSTFEQYFSTKQEIENNFTPIIRLRNSGMHAGQRQLYLTEQLDALAKMVTITKSFHPATAERIDEILRHTIATSQADESEADPTQPPISTNLGEFPDAQLVGREEELRALAQFWSDDFKRVLSIVGAGGVGKTSLLDAFLNGLLSDSLEVSDERRPDAIIYLTAKDNYLRFMQPAPESRQFRTLRRICEVTLDTIWGESSDGKDLDQLKRSVFEIAKTFRILFALDNLENLTDEEFGEIGMFLDDLPRRSKAILTTRMNRRFGHSIQLEGLPAEAAERLFCARIADFNYKVSEDDLVHIREFIAYSGGFPLAIIYAANLVGLGHSVEEILEKVKGKEFLDLLKFSFESSIEQLEPQEIQVLVFLALSKSSRSRKDLREFTTDDDQLDEVIAKLRNMSFIKGTSEEQKHIRFVFDNPQLRDYTLSRARELMSEVEYGRLLRKAGVLPDQAGSQSVAIEIDRALERARNLGSWGIASAELERTLKIYPDDPRLLTQLGYYYFRMEKRDIARTLLHRAISTGFAEARAHVYLALVYFYERQYDEALRQATTALTLRARYPKADQIAGECLLAKATQGALLIDDGARISLLQEAASHLRRSILVQEITTNDTVHNQLSQQLLDRAEKQIADLNQQRWRRT